ncbi:MAG: N-acetylglucosamine-6-phosphate deacetylase [Streptococcaceae bacterium]|jgi:N-acetylglucosamine-6-phosphate deacetylase|nr:N-acetylglucosamine-6-phosphate deacetylase [Streptococcaceae bacterium]
MVIIKSKNVLIGEGFEAAALAFENGKIIEILPYAAQTMVDYDFQENMIVPGFIDLHLHGGYGDDCLDYPQEGFDRLRRNLLLEGTTSFLATSTSLDRAELISRLVVLGGKIVSQALDFGANCLGIHLEGPFLNVKFAGAQNPQSIISPSVECFEAFNQAGRNQIKRITLAPEEDEDFSLIRYLHEKGFLVSMGHSGARKIEAELGEKHGAQLITHMFNGMPQIHHREISLAGYAMLSNDLVCEFIADGIHVSFEAIDLVRKTKGRGKMILITDSNRAKGMPLGDYVLHGRPVVLSEDDSVRLKETGGLAGSVLKLNNAVKNTVENTRIDLVEALQMASLYPAELLGIDNVKGRIQKGYDADIVVLDADYQVQEAFVGGKCGDVNAIQKENGCVGKF